MAGPLDNSETQPLLSAAEPIPVQERNDDVFVDVPSTRVFANSPRRSSIVYGSLSRSGVIGSFSRRMRVDAAIADEYNVVTAGEAAQFAKDEQTLLRDSNIPIPAGATLPDIVSSPLKRHSVAGLVSSLGGQTFPQVGSEVIETAKVWDDAVSKGKVTTTPRRELIVIVQTSTPLIVTFLLQYSLTVASIFSVGHLGKAQLGAVSLASMTASITGFALMQGLATCLDTLCSQAYGARNYYQVGFYFQKCAVMILCAFLPVSVLWVYSASVLALIIPDKELAILAQQYLRVVVFGAPGMILFECGKRYVQAQGIFHASTAILLVCAPLNALLNYVLVWNKTIGIGYLGAPLAVAITDWLMPTLLLAYVYFIDGRQCWGGFSKNIFKNWGPMIKLAIPGVIMVEAEFLAFEIMTLTASYFGTVELAAQSVASTISSLTYQIPFAVSIAASTRIANFVGATLSDAAKITTFVALSCSLVVSIFNFAILYFFRYKIGHLFSNDPEVIDMVGRVLAICAVVQLADGPGAVLGGILRGQGRQKVGGYLNLGFYYLFAIPLGLVLGFSLNWQLIGLWVGIGIGLFFIGIGQAIYIFTADWDSIVKEAQARAHEERIVSH